MGPHIYSVHGTPEDRIGICETPYKFIFVPSFGIGTIFLADNMSYVIETVGLINFSYEISR